MLVVDDEANIRDLVSLYLTAAGYAVATAADGISVRPTDLRMRASVLSC
ncbi:MAG: hypothetical protein ACYC6T_18915 [Thermoleophilia bacterium]